MVLCHGLLSTDLDWIGLDCGTLLRDPDLDWANPASCRLDFGSLDCTCWPVESDMCCFGRVESDMCCVGRVESAICWQLECHFLSAVSESSQVGSRQSDAASSESIIRRRVENAS